MLVAVLATGGKDSALSLYHALQEGYEVQCLVSMIPLREDSWMFHYPNIQLVSLFADAAVLPIIKTETAGIKEEEVEDLKHVISRLDVEGVVSGAISSNYQKSRLERICLELNLKCITPLWQRDPMDILTEIQELRFDVIFTGVYAHGFDAGWLSRRIDKAAVDGLVDLHNKFGVSLVGEGGEYETLVLDAPFFTKRIAVIESEKVWKDGSGFLSIHKAELEDKQVIS